MEAPSHHRRHAQEDDPQRKCAWARDESRQASHFPPFMVIFATTTELDVKATSTIHILHARNLVGL